MTAKKVDAKAINYNGSELVVEHMFDIGAPKYQLTKTPEEFIGNVLAGIDSSYVGLPEDLFRKVRENSCTVMLFRLAQVTLIAAKQEGTK